jgi:CBS domain-containing protein
MAIGTHCLRATRTAAPDETAAAAARRMQAEHVGCLVVVEHERAIGVVTDRDLALHVLCDDLDPEQERVRDAMHAPVVSIRQDASLEDAVEALRKASVRRLVVTDEAGKPAGVFAADDFLRLLATEIGDLAEALRVQFTQESKGASAGGSSHA